MSIFLNIFNQFILHFIIYFNIKFRFKSFKFGPNLCFILFFRNKCNGLVILQLFPFVKWFHYKILHFLVFQSIEFIYYFFQFLIVFEFTISTRIKHFCQLLFVFIALLLVVTLLFSILLKNSPFLVEKVLNFFIVFVFLQVFECTNKLSVLINSIPISSGIIKPKRNFLKVFFIIFYMINNNLENF